jgi:hypothetical protein
MTDPTEPPANEARDVEDAAIGGWEPVGGATIRAVPFMSDQFFRLAKNLRGLSSQHPDDISLPAGTVLISIAALEAYVNELAEVALRDANRRDFDAHRDNLIRKLQLLNARGNTPGQLESDVEEDIALLYGLRGKLMHYRADPEHPVDTSTSLQRLVARFPEAVTSDADVSTAQLLTPHFAEWAVDRVSKAIEGLYQCGWEPPRPRWLELVDPTRLAK